MRASRIAFARLPYHRRGGHMTNPFSRRAGFKLVSLALPFRQTLMAAAPGAPVHAAFPAQPTDLVREMVTVSHGNLKRVRELVEAHPALAKAAIDWGFGDWETALGAASHTGSREIAELLIAKGARPTLFSAVMMGQLDVVKAFLAAQPGAQRILGPHSIPLLTHAKLGGPPAAEVYRYLDSLGDAAGTPHPPTSDAEITRLPGTYVYGAEPAEQIAVAANGRTLTFTRAGTVGRPLYHVAENEFFPAGAESVRIRFAEEDGAMLLRVHDPDVVLSARRAK
jgi:hypothetical protein